MRPSAFRHQRSHPSRHLLYAFFVGAAVTALGFTLARLEQGGPDASDARATVVVAGSETLKPWFLACAEAFMSRRRHVDVVVRGGGTATGIAALLAGQVDLALSSREPTSAEIERGAQAAGGIQAWPVATEAIAILTHPAVPIERLDTRTLGKLLDGSITDWSALGAPAGAVVVVGRAGGSGTASVVEARILEQRPLAPNARRLASHDEVVDAVAATAGAIGYANAQVARRHESRVKPVALGRDDASRAVLPEAAAIERGDYPLARTLYIVGLGRAQGPSAELLDFCRGAETRQLREAAGFLPVVATDPLMTQRR